MEKLNTILGIAMLGLILIAGVLAWNAKATTIIQNGNAVEDRGLTVQGTSKITVAPDEAEISFRIVTEGKT
ncbi:MAG: SIMPL domain-containing protein, partial [Candidatus Nanoarchaeia archaeon]